MTPLTITEYYRHPDVRRRIREYCGASSGSPLTCLFLSAVPPTGDGGWMDARRYAPSELDLALAEGTDLSRSMWDSHSLLVHLDMDYQHADRPNVAVTSPADAFVKLEPARRAVKQLLETFGLPLLTVMTGRGYHFTGRVPLEDSLVTELSAIAPIPPWLATFAARRPAWAPATMTERLARAYSALGMLVEYFAHETIRCAAPQSHIPVVINGTVVGHSPWGRECTSLDFSYAGDPLDLRHIRVAFSAYQAHGLPDNTATLVPVVIAIPIGARPLLDVLEAGRETNTAAALAADTSAEIPVVTDGVARLLDSYLASPLARFHRDFYDTLPDEPSHWPMTYDRFEIKTLPRCVSAPLMTPNDLLLKPEHIQHLTRYLLSLGWHPRHIAGLVHSRYAHDFHWGSRWSSMDRQSRADFDVRVFAGMVATGLDEGVDFNCRSAQEKGLCPSGSACAHDLRQDRDRLLARLRS